MEDEKRKGCAIKSAMHFFLSIFCVVAERYRTDDKTNYVVVTCDVMYVK